MASRYENQIPFVLLVCAEALRVGAAHPTSDGPHVHYQDHLTLKIFSEKAFC